MKYQPGTHFSNSLLPVIATDKVDGYGNTIWFNHGTGDNCIVVRGRLFGEEMAKHCHDTAVAANAHALFDALRSLTESCAGIEGPAVQTARDALLLVTGPEEYIAPEEPTAKEADPLTVYAFECHVFGHRMEKPTIINHRDDGSAKAQFLEEISEYLHVDPSRVFVREVGPAQSSEQFLENAVYRGIPDARCGMKVTVKGAPGVLVGHNSSANLSILFAPGGRYGDGMHPLNVHPNDVEFNGAAPRERMGG